MDGWAVEHRIYTCMHEFIFGSELVVPGTVKHAVIPTVHVKLQASIVALVR